MQRLTNAQTKEETERHLEQRRTQRNAEWSDIEIALAYGREIHRCGAEFYFLGERQLPESLRRTHARLNGLTVVVVDGEIRTVYRNGRALTSIKRKRKHSWCATRPHRR